ncbi:Uncharacterised protein [Klebsiella michiganensis]|nr:Uncharacterised protein [Klebsiella michiganensis]
MTKKRPDERASFSMSIDVSKDVASGAHHTLLKISEPLVPPKPKELHRVYSRSLT